MTTVVQRRAARVRRLGGARSDPYLTQGPPRTTAQCSGCSAVYRNKRWQLAAQTGTAPKKGGRRLVLCPACRKVRDRYPNGVVTIHWPTQPRLRESMLNLIKNQEAWGRKGNPLERILSMEAGPSLLTITTTNERLAQRLGRAIERAFHGKVVYRWSRGDKLARVDWSAAGK
jgi:hypothetical protein